MVPQLKLIPGAIFQMIATSADTGYLTLADRYGLLAAAIDESINEEERRCANRILRSVVRGRLQISDRISTMS